MIRFLLTILTVCLLLPATFAQAQDSTTDASTSDVNASISQIMEKAAESGMTVIILDGNGTPMASTETGEASADPISETTNMTAVMRLQWKLEGVNAVLLDRLEHFPAALNEVLFILRASSPDQTIFFFAKQLFITLFFLAIGVLFERQIYGKRIARHFVVPLIKDAPQGYTQKLPFLLVRFIGGVIGVFVSMAVAALLGLITFGPSDDSAVRFTVASIFAAYALTRLIALIWRMILSPYLPQYRIPAFSTPDAKKLHLWVCGLGMVDAITIIFGEWLSELGLVYDVYAMMTFVMSSLFALGNVAMVFANRTAIANALRNGRPSTKVPLATRLASTLWAPIFLVYIVFGWARLTWNLIMGNDTEIPLIAGAYVILTAVLVVYATINYGIERYFERSRNVKEMNDAADALREEAEDEGTLSEQQEQELSLLEDLIDHRQMNTFEELARRVSGVLALVAGLYAALYIFNLDHMLTDDMVSGRMLDVVVILFMGYIGFHTFRIWIDRRIREESGDSEAEAELGDEGGGASASRLATLLPLFRNFILLVILVTIILIVLMELGVNVSPLFAGAGVVGLAVGFGAQSLVRDIFSGAFFLFDDAFRKGEYIDIGSVKGTVEKISVRSFQLRHHLGPLHTIPFGEIQYLTNYSRDWVIMKLKLRVTYDTDVERVRKLVKNLGIALLDDPVIGHNFIQPLKSQGVVEMQDSAMIIRVKFMTKPGDQWLVRKKVYQEIRELFAREGIKFAHREVTVRIADDEKAEELTPKQREAVVGAVEAAIDEDAMEGGPAGGGGD
ncbi:mechanosensitive ion channel domain-containing protein [Shimia marina]|uniref:Putative MscS family protein YkuT n=1 Tax=Shimia marina TaxID=321267 RepID=A0A0N7LRM6_9RHOB|nr:mechanosensitive ion channel domain-containing protein [Shimia marina]CUH51244.1 putative MscS family protein YkuT [Shimia marina]SFD54149.1 Small-conductance mechanosensitive channel [Shimia marina]